MDKGLWISWYDLGEADRKGYLSWLHEHYLPGILKRTGVIWAAHYEAEKMAPPSRLGHTKDQSVPQGGEYILLVGGETAQDRRKDQQPTAVALPATVSATRAAAASSASTPRVIIDTDLSKWWDAPQ